MGARCLSPPWVHTCIDHADLEELVLLVPSVLSGSYTLLRPRPQGSLGPERRDLMETFYLELSIPRSLALCILSGCGSLYLFPSAARGSFSNDG